MPTINNPGSRTSEGPISYADVLAHIPTDPETGVLQANNTNAGVIRAALGRGSFATVQKHLEAIRSELATAAAAPQTGATPEAPAEAVAALWAAAWTAAQRDVLQRLDRVTTERDLARARVEVLAADLEAATNAADLAADQAHAALQARDQAQTRQSELEAALAAERKATEDAKAMVVSEREKAQHAAEIAAREREIERQALQGQIERLQERVAEFRALEIWAASQKGNETERKTEKGQD